MIQATEGVSRNILKQQNMPPSLQSNVVEQMDSSSDYVKHSPMRTSSAYEADTPHKASKIVKKLSAINPTERVKTEHRKVNKGPNFMYGKGFNELFSKIRLMVGKLYFSRVILPNKNIFYVRLAVCLFQEKTPIIQVKKIWPCHN